MCGYGLSWTGGLVAVVLTSGRNRVPVPGSLVVRVNCFKRMLVAVFTNGDCLQWP
jgi:hypothetical protein